MPKRSVAERSILRGNFEVNMGVFLFVHPSRLVNNFSSRACSSKLLRTVSQAVGNWSTEVQARGRRVSRLGVERWSMIKSAVQGIFITVEVRSIP